MLLLHGAGASSHSWAALMPHLADRHRVIALDLPGHGWTRSPRGRARLGDVASDISALCVQEGWSPGLVIGHSAGGAISLELARQGLLQPRQLVVVNGALENFRGAAGVAVPGHGQGSGAEPVHRAVDQRREGGRCSRCDRSCRRAGSTLDDAGLARYAHLIQRRAHVDGTLAMMAQWSLDDLNRALPDIAVPTLFLHGEKDGAVDLSVARRAASVMPMAELVTLPGVGHLAQEEVPDRVAAEIRRFTDR
ncbi:MAG: alpha/beta fold hydrolase BchO [Roseicyclus sp.]|uniref:alpha/beta fold hydrolase BchO n=1 Tax=Roseicyclus sp. TaxID=1914329 RepID=UPI003A8AC2B8